MRINVHINPGTSRNEILVLEDLLGTTVYKVSVTEKPINGKANEALELILADYFKVKKRQIRVVSGFKSRYKVVEVTVDT